MRRQRTVPAVYATTTRDFRPLETGAVLGMRKERKGKFLLAKNNDAKSLKDKRLFQSLSASSPHEEKSLQVWHHICFGQWERPCPPARRRWQSYNIKRNATYSGTISSALVPKGLAKQQDLLHLEAVVLFLMYRWSQATCRWPHVIWDLEDLRSERRVRMVF